MGTGSRGHVPKDSPDAHAPDPPAREDLAGPRGRRDDAPPRDDARAARDGDAPSRAVRDDDAPPRPARDDDTPPRPARDDDTPPRPARDDDTPPRPARGPVGDRDDAPARALRALLAPDPRLPALIADAAGAAVTIPGERLAEAGLARRLRETGAEVVVTHALGPTLLRALRERPPALLVVTGPAAADELPLLPGTCILGPDARLWLGDAGDAVACATSPAELAALLTALADLSPGTAPDLRAGGVRLAACPTPAWWPAWLADPRLAGATAVGFVAAAALHPGWARWARAQDPAATHVLVPLGLPPAQLDPPRHPSLAAAVAADALERYTGPVFPSPQVLALLRRDVRPVAAADAAAQALWSQARRALPLLGAAPGMEAPRADLPATAPLPAFLAQRAQIRRERTRALARAAADAAPAVDPAAVARAEEVLRSAGQVLSEHESKVVLRGFGVEITRQAVAGSASGAAQFAETIGYPVVLKALSPDLRRKQEVGAVVLGLTTAAAVRRAYATIVHNVETHAPTAHLDGVLVAEQAPDGLEIECGAARLPGGEVALYGRALGQPVPSERCFALSPLRPVDARLLADAVLARVPLPALRRASDPGVGELADLFLRLDALVRHFEAVPEDMSDRTGPRRQDPRDMSSGPGSDGRLVSVELGPIRLVGPPRGYVTLDARIVQRAHLEGL
jgi:acetyltransferase